MISIIGCRYASALCILKLYIVITITYITVHFDFIMFMGRSRHVLYVEVLQDKTVLLFSGTYCPTDGQARISGSNIATSELT